MFGTGKISNGITVIKANRSQVSEEDLLALEKRGSIVFRDYTNDLVVVTSSR